MAKVLTYFDRCGSDNGPREVVTAASQLLRGTALGFRNLRDRPMAGVVEADP